MPTCSVILVGKVDFHGIAVWLSFACLQGVLSDSISMQGRSTLDSTEMAYSRQVPPFLLLQVLSNGHKNAF